MKLKTILEQVYLESDADTGKMEIDKKMTEKTLEDSFVVGNRGLNFIKDQIERLNKKATKIGVPPLELKILSSKEETRPGKDKDFPIRVMRHTIKILGKSPVIEGWEFIASVEHTAAGNILNIAPNSSVKSLPTEYRTANATCDYCHTKRDRNNTYVLKNIQTGEFKRIGRNCLKNFIPDKSPKQLIDYAAYLERALSTAVGGEDMEDNDYEGCRGGRSNYYSADTFLYYICLASLIDGYVSGKKAKESELGGRPKMSTAHFAQKLMLDREVYKDFEDKIKQKHEEATKLKEKIEDWKDSKDWDVEIEKNPNMADYFNNMKVISKSEALQYKNAGYHASLLGLYFREQNQAQKQSQAKTKTYIGTVGQKVMFIGKIVNKRPYNSAYGAGTMYIFNDIDNNNEIVWFASGSPGFEMGDSVKAVGTVKAHQVSKYNGSPQTIIKNVKMEPA